MGPGLYAEIFPRGGQIWGTDKRGGGGGAEAYARCYTLHLLGGGGARMTQGGVNAPPPLKYSPGTFIPCREGVRDYHYGKLQLVQRLSSFQRVHRWKLQTTITKTPIQSGHHLFIIASLLTQSVRSASRSVTSLKQTLITSPYGVIH